MVSKMERIRRPTRVKMKRGGPRDLYLMLPPLPSEHQDQAPLKTSTLAFIGFMLDFFWASCKENGPIKSTITNYEKWIENVAGDQFRLPSVADSGCRGGQTSSQGSEGKAQLRHRHEHWEQSQTQRL